MSRLLDIEAHFHEHLKVRDAINMINAIGFTHVDIPCLLGGTRSLVLGIIESHEGGLRYSVLHPESSAKIAGIVLSTIETCWESEFFRSTMKGANNG